MQSLQFNIVLYIILYKNCTVNVYTDLVVGKVCYYLLLSIKGLL